MAFTKRKLGWIGRLKKRVGYLKHFDETYL
jgi:hypothetical protein